MTPSNTELVLVHFFLFLFLFNLTYSRWTSSLPSCLWSLRVFPSLPGSRLTIFLSRCKFSTLTTRQLMVEFYLLTFPHFPLRKKEHKSYFGKNRTHDFRTSRCAGYLLDHSGDEGTTHIDVVFQKISCFVFQEISIKHDGYMHTHFALTDINSRLRRKRLPTQPPRRTLYVGYSTSIVSLAGAVCTGRCGAKLGWFGLSPV